MVRRRANITGTLFLFCTLFTACGSDTADAPTNNQPDAPVTVADARPPDAAPPDARPPDAPAPDAGPTFSGTIAIHDIQLLSPPNQQHTTPTVLAQGAQFTLSFTQDGAPTVEAQSMPSDFLGNTVPCNASFSMA